MKRSDAIFERWMKSVSPGGCMEAPPEVDASLAARMLANQEEYVSFGNRAERRKRKRK